MAKALKVVGKIASVAAVVLAFVPGGQPFAAAATAIAGVANTAAQALTKPQPSGGQVSKSIIDTSAPSPYIMGRFRSGGVLVHDAAHGAEYKDIPNPNRDLVYVYSDCGPVQEVEGYSSDGAYIGVSGQAGGYYGENMAFSSQLGRVRETTALSGINGSIPNWGASYRLSGKAAGIFSLRWDKDQRKFQGGLPDLTGTIKGVLAYDPRRDSTYPGGDGPNRLGDETTYTYSTNPSAHAITYLYGRYVTVDGSPVRIFGVGLPASGIDMEAFVDWANVCDANGWEVNGRIFEPADKFNNFRLILEAGGARPAHNLGKISVSYDAPKISLATFTQEDLAPGDIDIPASQGIRDKINSVIPRYMSPEHNWEYVPGSAVQSQTYIDADGELFRREYQYSLVTDPQQAAQIAGYDLVNARELTDISLTMKPVVRVIPVGGVVTLNMPDIGLQGNYELTSKTLDPLDFSVAVVFRSVSEGRDAFAMGSTTTPPQIPTLTFGEDYDRLASAFSGRDDRASLVNLTTYVRGIIISGINDGSIDISDHERINASNTSTAINGGSITGLDLETLYYIYYDDPSGEGGDVTYQATTDEAASRSSTDNPTRYYVGYVTTPGVGEPPTEGYGANAPTAIPLRVPDAQSLGGITHSDIVNMFTQVDVSINLAVAPLEQADAALADADQAIITAMQTLNTTLSTSISQIATTGEAADNLLSGRIDSNLQGIETLEEFVDGEASRLTSLAVSASLSGLLPNGDFATGTLDGWSNNLFSTTSLDNVAELRSEFEGRPNVLCVNLPGRVNIYSTGIIQVDPSKSYILEGSFKTTSTTGHIVNLGVYCFDAFGNVISSPRYSAFPVIDSSDDWIGISGILQGEGQDATPPLTNFQPGTVAIRVALFADITEVASIGSSLYVDGLNFRDASTEVEQSSRIDDLDIVTLDHATRLSSVETTSGDNSSSILTLNTTTATQAITLNTLTTTTGEHTSQISTLQQTSADEVLRVNELFVTAGENASNITTVQQATAETAIDISNLQTTTGEHTTEISTLQQTQADEVTRLTSLSITATTIGITPNGSFEAGTLDGWYTTAAFSVSVSDRAQYEYTEEHDGELNILTVAGIHNRRDVYSSLVPIDTSRTYRVHAVIKNTGTAARYYAGYRAYNADGVLLANVNSAFANITLSAGDGWERRSGNAITGEAASGFGSSFPIGTYYLQPFAWLNFGNAQTGGATHLAELYIEDVTAEEQVLSQINILDNLTADHATRLLTVETASGENSSAISDLNTTTATTALSVETLDTTVSGHTSSITALNTTTGEQATSITELTTDVGVNASSITTLQQTTGDAALSITSLETVIGADDWLRNGRFTRWNQGAPRPVGYIQEGTGTYIRETSITRFANASRQSSVTNQDTGMYLSSVGSSNGGLGSASQSGVITPFTPTRYFVLEAWVYLVSGSWSGAGLYVTHLDGNSGVRFRALSFHAEGFPSGQWVKFQHVHDIGFEPPANWDGFLLHGMTNSSLFGVTRAAKTVIWGGFSARPATGPEVDATLNTASINEINIVQAGQASQITTLTSTTGDNSATVALHTTAISTLEQGAAAGILFRAGAGGNNAVLELVSYTNAAGGAVSSARIAADNLILDGTIQSAHIGDLQVETLHIGDNAVTVPSFRFEDENTNMAFNNNGGSAAKTWILTQNHTSPATGSPIKIDVSLEFGVSSLGNVGGSSDNVTLVEIFAEVQRSTGHIVATRIFGQYVLDGDNTANERFNTIRFGNSLPFFDEPPAGPVQYRVYVWASRITASSTITGFVPNVSNQYIGLTEFKK